MNTEFEYEDPNSGEIINFDLEYTVSIGDLGCKTGNPDNWEPPEGDDLDIIGITPDKAQHPVFAAMWEALQQASKTKKELKKTLDQLEEKVTVGLDYTNLIEKAKNL
jgi:hypothetical protein